MRAARAVELSDETLMDLYARGDGAAFDELFARYEQRAYAFFLQRTRSEDRAADLYQELFLRLHCARESYDPGRPFAPWFFEIARHLLVDAWRRSRRCAEDPLLDEAAYAGPAALGPEHRFAAAEQAHAVLAQLSGVERYVLVSAKVHGREYSELAGELGRSAAALKKLASRAMQRLRARERNLGELATSP
jgi:RNA polymerase sigma-70 factor (ECF subfamily)